jgi:hypothetical protein
MNNRMVSRVVEILETAPDFFMPVKKLWLRLQEEGLAQTIELEDFHRMLLSDERFEFTPGVDYKEGIEDTPELTQEMEPEMEALGFYSGPRVKLASREMTPEDVFAAMARNLAQMNAALQGAWETRPEDNQDVEDQLLDILAAGQRLEREFQTLIEQQKEQLLQDPNQEADQENAG